MTLELERLRLANVNFPLSSPQPSEASFKKSTPEMRKLMPKFDPEETDMSLYLDMFERQAKNAQVEKSDWATQLLTLLPLEIGQIILREPNADSQSYEDVKRVLLARFKLSPETFRKKFMQHSRKVNARWSDFAYELENYFDGWIEGLKIKTFDQLKCLIITDQMKRKVSPEVREHFVDVWGDITKPTDLAGKLDKYEEVRPHKIFSTKKKDVVFRKPDEGKTKNVEREKDSKPEAQIYKPPHHRSPSEEKRKVEAFEKRRQIFCYTCGEKGHISPSCPNKHKREAELNHMEIDKEANEWLKPYMSEGEVDGRKLRILRDTGASFDLISSSYAPPDTFTGEIVYIRQPLDNESRSLPVAKVNLKGNFGEITTKAAVFDTEFNRDRYILGNRTAELIQKNSKVEQINAVTRSQSRKLSTESELSKVRNESQAAATQRKEDSECAIVMPETPSVSEEIFLDLSPADNRVNKLLACGSEELAAEQKKCETLKSIWEMIAERKANCPYVEENGILFRIQKTRLGEDKKLIVVPRKFRAELMEFCHDIGASHLGVIKTRDRLARNFFWPGCHREIDDFVRSCDPCQRAGKSLDKKKAPMKLVPVIREVFAKINIDACGPLPVTENGNRYLITAICLASKYPEAVAVKDISSVSVTDALLQMFSRIGFPKQVQCDNGTSFTSNLTSEFFERFNIKVVHSSIAHPQSNPVERFHRTLKRLLRVLCVEAKEEWDRHLPAALLALRTVTHESIGFSPSELVFGKNLRTPDVLLYEHWANEEEVESLVTEHVFQIINRLKRSQDLAVERMTELREKRKLWYDRNAVKREFKVKDRVLVLATTKPHKLSVQWIGPGVVEEKISETNYVVRMKEGRERSRVYHINMLKPYFERPELINLVIAGSEQMEPVDADWDFPCVIEDPTKFDVEKLMGESKLEGKLEDAQISQLRNLLMEFSSVFSEKPGLTNLVTHHIELTSDRPIRTRAYRASHRQNEILKEEVEKMLKLGIIEVGESEYASPMILVEVSGKPPRPCIDFRRLNEITRTEFFPLPNIEERVERVSAAKYITVLDLSKGYWQIPLDEKAQKIAAFVTSFGTYRPLRMPFGLKNAPFFFSKLMAEILQGCDEFAVPYLDDIAVYTEDWESHVKALREVLSRLKRANLKVKPTKCHFAQARVQYLGHVVGSGVRSPAEAKIQCVKEFPQPTTKKQMRAFLGLTGYYSRYVKDYATIATPLTDTLKGKNKQEKIKWSPECEDAFTRLKGSLTKFPVLHAPDFTREFLIQCDASDSAIGVVLTQIFDGEEHPIVFLSRKFSPAERNYSTIERECAAIVFAVRKLHFYLDGSKFRIISDHRPLRWLKTNSGSNSRILRWSLILQPYNYEIEHRAGNLNQNADTLSRIGAE